MVRTQIQLPDELYARSKRLAEAKEVSLAELVRRGLEYMLSIHPLDHAPRTRWKLEAPAQIGLKRDPFADADWRIAANTGWENIGKDSTLMLNEREGKP